MWDAWTAMPSSDTSTAVTVRASLSWGRATGQALLGVLFICQARSIYPHNHPVRQCYFTRFTDEESEPQRNKITQQNISLLCGPLVISSYLAWQCWPLPFPWSSHLSFLVIFLLLLWGATLLSIFPLLILHWWPSAPFYTHFSGYTWQGETHLLLWLPVPSICLITTKFVSPTLAASLRSRPVSPTTCPTDPNAAVQTQKLEITLNLFS